MSYEVHDLPLIEIDNDQLVLLKIDENYLVSIEFMVLVRNVGVRLHPFMLGSKVYFLKVLQFFVIYLLAQVSKPE